MSLASCRFLNALSGRSIITIATFVGGLITVGSQALAQNIGIVADDGTGSVTVFDADADIVLGSVTLPARGSAVGDCAVTDDRTLGFVTDFGSRIWVIDLTTTPPTLAAGTNPIPISNNGEDVVISPDGRFLLVCDGSAVQPVSVVDIASRTEISTLSLASDCNSIDICPDGSVLVTSFNTSTVSRLTLNAAGVLTNTGEVLTVPNPMNVYCAPDGKSGIVVRFGLTIISFTIPGLTQVDSRSLSGFGSSGVFNTDGTKFYVRNDIAAVQVFGFNSSSGSLSASPLLSFPISSGTQSFFGMDQMALHPNQNKLYVSVSGALDVYDPGTGALLNSITGPSISAPTGVSFSSVPAGLVCVAPADTMILLCAPTQVQLPFQVFDTCGGVTCQVVSGPGTLIGNMWTYTPAADEIVTVAIMCTDTCGNTCVDTFTVTFDINDAPLCNLPNDTLLGSCVGGEIHLSVSGSDQNGNFLQCQIVSGPGILLGDSLWSYSPTTDGSVTVTIECLDSCGVSCQGSFTVQIIIADIEPPVITCPPDILVQCPADVPPPDTSACNLSSLFASAPGEGLYRINPLTGTSVFVGSLGISSIPALAVDPTTGIMYLGTGGGNPNIYTVDTVTAQVTFVGSTGLGFGAVGALEFDADGVLYAAVNIVNAGGSGSDHLATINKATGLASVIGSFGSCPTCLEGMEGLAFDASGQLWGSLSERGLAGDPGLYRIDVNTGAATFITTFKDNFGNPPSGGVVSLKFGCANILYGGTATALGGNDGGQLISIDPTSGQFTTIATITGGRSLGGLAGFRGGSIQVTDNCDPDPQIVFLGSVTDGQTCPETITRTYQATDASGNSAICVQTILVHDTIAPVCIVSPARDFFQCLPIEACVPVQISDNCDTDVTSQLIAGPGTLTDTGWCYTPTVDEVVSVTIRCIDDCGNITDVTFTATFDINETPICGIPNDTSVVICPTELISRTITTVDPDNNLASCTVVSGPGSIVDGVWRYEPLFDETATVTILCIDECGETCQGSFVITIDVDDPIPPVITCPPTIQVQCAADVPPPDISICNASSLFASAPGEGLYRINPLTGTSVFVGSMGISSIPALAVDPTTGIMYLGTGGGNPSIYTVDTATAQVTFLGSTGLGFGAVGALEFDKDGVLYAAVNIVNDGGSGSDHLATINKGTGLASVIGPFGNCPTCLEGMEGLAFDPSGQLWGSLSERGLAGAPGLYKIDVNTGAATFFTTFKDNFGNPPSGGVVSLEFGCANILYGGTATALGGNDGGQLISIDPTSGQFTTIAAVTGGRSLGGLAGFRGGSIQVTDNCDPDPTVTHIGDVSDGRTCPETILRTYRATDDAGNFAECVQTIIVNDTIAPICFLPNDTTFFQCQTLQVCLPVTATDNCDTQVACEIVSGPGTLLNGFWCYTPAAEEVATVAILCTDACGNTCVDTFTVTFDINQAPVCIVPADTSVFYCEPTEICLPVSVTDEDNNVFECIIKAGPGTLIDGEWCHTPTVDQTSIVTISCIDSCGAVCESVFEVRIDINEPPVLTCLPDTTMRFNEILVLNPTATDPELATYAGEKLTFSLGPNSAGFATISASTGAITLVPRGEDVCEHIIEVIVTDSCGLADSCSFNVCVINTPPIAICDTVPNRICWGLQASGAVNSTDEDSGPFSANYSVVSFDGPGMVNINPATGEWTWDTEEDAAYIGNFQLCVAVTDGANICDPCSPTNADTCCLEIVVVQTYRIAIESKDPVLQGGPANLAINLEGDYPSYPMAGFDFLIEYDASVLAITGASEGDFLNNNAWEFFTFRFGPNGNCNSGCPSGTFRMVALADLNDGRASATGFTNTEAGSNQLAVMHFQVSSDRTLQCNFVGVNWRWFDCGDNTISSVSGDSLFISRFVYTREGDFGDGGASSIHNQDQDFPTLLGATAFCNTSGGEGKPTPLRKIDFKNGGMKLACNGEVDDRGDINLNGVKNEIADAVLFTNYFISGIGVFTIPSNVGGVGAGQIQASDVNADGLVLTVADLVYLIRVIVGDALPINKLSHNSKTAVITTQGPIVSTDIEMGAALFVFIGAADIELLQDGLTMRTGMRDGNTYALVAPEVSEANGLSTATATIRAGEIISSVTNGANATLLSVEASTYDGSILNTVTEILPERFALSQNYPNPFNPSTKINIDLPSASEYTLTIYNINGQKVHVITGSADAGFVTVEWDASAMASGIYFYKVTAGKSSMTKKMLLLK